MLRGLNSGGVMQPSFTMKMFACKLHLIRESAFHKHKSCIGSTAA
jgi:hypothetical protein